MTAVAGLVGLAAEVVAGHDGGVSWHVARPMAGKGGWRREGPRAPRPACAPACAPHHVEHSPHATTTCRHDDVTTCCKWRPRVGNGGEQYLRGKQVEEGLRRSRRRCPVGLSVGLASASSRRQRTQPPCGWWERRTHVADPVESRITTRIRGHPPPNPTLATVHNRHHDGTPPTAAGHLDEPRDRRLTNAESHARLASFESNMGLCAAEPDMAASTVGR